MGVKPKALEEVPECPPDLLYVWEWYLDIFSGTRLSYQEIHYWTLAKNISPHSWEIDLLRSIDKVFWEVHNGG